jgi:hypothetical protein
LPICRFRSSNPKTPRMAADKFTLPMMLDLYRDLHKTIRVIDPYRMIATGDAMPRKGAWNNRHRDDGGSTPGRNGWRCSPPTRRRFSPSPRFTLIPKIADISRASRSVWKSCYGRSPERPVATGGWYGSGNSARRRRTGPSARPRKRWSGGCFEASRIPESNFRPCGISPPGESLPADP